MRRRTLARPWGLAARSRLRAVSGVDAATVQASLAAREPEAPAILAPGHDELSAAALMHRIAGIGGALHAAGIGRGDRVAVVAGLGPDAAVALLGTMSWATCVPVNRSAPAELDALLEETGARALLAPDGATAEEREAASRLGLALFDGLDPAIRDGAPSTPKLAPAVPDDIALVLRTSGTTSRAKLVPATHRQLVARADAARRAMDLTTKDRCLGPMPLCYGHGLYTGLLIPLLTGGSTILPDRLDRERFVECLRVLSPTWYTAGPVQQRAILDWLRDGRDEAPTLSLRFARCANGSLPPSVSEELEAVLGVRMLESYGTSETGMIASPAPHGQRKRGTVGRATGVEIAVVDEAGSSLPAGATGEIVVRGPTVFSGYVGQPALTKRSLEDGWFRTGDRGSLDADGFLTVDGRLDDVINRGGEKVSPAEVQTALLQHPSVASAVVFGMPHRTLEEEVAAAVTLKPGSDADEFELRSYLGAALAPFKIPRRIVALPELPVGPTGKPLRAGLAERLGLAADRPDGSEPEPEPQPQPRPLEARLAVLWGEALERPAAGLDDDFFELGGDSLAALGLLAAIDEDLNVALELEALVEAPTPRLLGRAMLRGSYLEEHATRPPRDVVGVNLEGDLPPLFVVGGRPGYALRTLVMAREIADELPVYGLQPPGMAWDSSGPTIPEMAAHYLTRMRELQPVGPYRLLGSSFGGLVVFELALQLERLGEEVEFLGLIDTEAPSMRWRPEARDAPDVPEDLDPTPESPGLVPGSIRSAATRVAAAHVQARRSYELTERVRSELTLFLCMGDGVAAGGDRRALWADASTGGFRLLALPGLHARFDREPQFSALRDLLRGCLLSDAPPGLDPAEVFDRTYTLESGSAGEMLRNGDGSSLRIDRRAERGWARTVRSAGGQLFLRGWASDFDGRRPAETVVAFLDGRFAGYASCGAATERVAQRLESPGLRHAGFRLRLEPDGAGTSPVPRVFALAGDGPALELWVRTSD
jgi:acyl-CoA synthetase (AMP-forming)/AMP-acid ligase II/surfactin synthase thioesterase subunit